MISLLLIGVASGGAAGVLLWSGLGRTHRFATLLLAYDSVLTLWWWFVLSRAGDQFIYAAHPLAYIVGNGIVCLLSACVGLEALRRCDVPIMRPDLVQRAYEQPVYDLPGRLYRLWQQDSEALRGQVQFQALCLVGCCAVTTKILYDHFALSPLQPMLAAYWAAAAVLGTVKQRVTITDPIDADCLTFLGTTRVMQAMRLSFLTLGPEWSVWFGYAATGAWAVWCIKITWRGFRGAAVPTP